MKEANVIFQGYNISKISMRQESTSTKNGDFEIIKKGFSNTKDKDIYKIVLEINCNKKLKILNIEIEGYFKFENISDEGIRSEFLNITAPTILYPYCRAFITTIYNFDSSDNIILPIINFANL